MSDAITDDDQLVSDSELVRRWLASYTETNSTMCYTRQHYVTRWFGIGSTAAAQVCRRHGFDPDQRVVMR